MNSSSRPQSNRRTVLKSMTVGSGAFLATASNVVGSTSARVEVVMEWRGNDPYVTRKVPKRWKQHMEKTRRLAEIMTNRYRDNGDVFGFERVPGSLNRGGKAAPQLGVRIRKGSGVKATLPNERDGVPIKAEEVENDQVVALTDTGCYNNYNFDHLRGGIIIKTTQDGQYPVSASGTTMAPAHRNGNHFCVTANHLFSEGSGQFPCDANWDDKADQHDTTPSSQDVGEVGKYREEMDYAMIPLSSGGMDAQYDVPNASWSGPITSHVDSLRLGELVENNTTVEKTGVTTGKTQGQINADSVDKTVDCLDTNNNFYRTGANVAKGDSGGPVYTPSESGDGISMIGLISGGPLCCTVSTECGEYVRPHGFGPPAWHISNEFNFQFGKP